MSGYTADDNITTIFFKLNALMELTIFTNLFEGSFIGIYLTHLIR